MYNLSRKDLKSVIFFFLVGQWRSQIFCVVVRIQFGQYADSHHNTQSHLCPHVLSVQCSFNTSPICHFKNPETSCWVILRSSFIPLQIHKHYSLFSSLPQIACLAFLSFQYPLLLFKGLKGTEKNNATEVSFDLSAFRWHVCFRMVAQPL